MNFQAEPDTLTLDYCYTRIENHYPLSGKIELQQDITDLSKKIISTGSYPQLTFGASATYQSETTELQFPAGSPLGGPELSKDQYKATMDVSQSIYNSGAVGIKKNLEEIHGRQEQQSTEIQLRQIKDQLNQVYFGILLARQQLAIIKTLSDNLRAQIRNVKSGVENGVLLPSQLYILEAELIKTRQDSTAILSNIRGGYQVLSRIIGEDIDPNTRLEIPENLPDYPHPNPGARLRPEFNLFESNRQAIDYRKDLVKTHRMPSLSAFGTAAYGRPGFNVFENDLHPYFIVGVRMRWSLWEAQNAATQGKIYDLQKKNVRQEERSFERQLRAELDKIRETILSLREQIQRDEKIIKLREKVVSVTSSQMKNGTATATEYVTELNKATQARLSMRMHKTKLIQAKVDYRTTLGATNKEM